MSLLSLLLGVCPPVPIERYPSKDRPAGASFKLKIRLGFVLPILSYVGMWWCYGALGTYFLGTQTGGRQRTWGVTGILLGPLGMLAALIIPAFQGRIPQTARARVAAFGITFGFLVISEVLVRSQAGQSALFYAFVRY